MKLYLHLFLCFVPDLLYDTLSPNLQWTPLINVVNLRPTFSTRLNVKTVSKERKIIQQKHWNVIGYVQMMLLYACLN